MKIGLLCLRYGEGGAGHHCESLAAELVALGHEVYVFAGQVREEVNREGAVPIVVNLGIKFGCGFPSLWSHRLRRTLRHLHPKQLGQLDVLNGNPVSGDFGQDAMKLGIPYVSTFHGSLRSMIRVETRFWSYRASAHSLLDLCYKTLDSTLERAEYRRSRVATFVSGSVRREYESLYGFKPGNLTIPPCPSRAFLSGDSTELGSSRTLGREENRILFVGTSLSRKGYFLLARAVSALVRVDTMARLVVVGGAGDARIRHLSDGAGISRNVEYLPHLSLPDLRVQMRRASVLAFPSVYEGLPLTVVEAMSQGLPAVGFDTTGVRDAIENGVSGLVVPFGDTVAFAKALELLLVDSSVRTRMGDACIRRARVLYEPSTVARQYVHAYVSAT